VVGFDAGGNRVAAKRLGFENEVTGDFGSPLLLSESIMSHPKYDHFKFEIGSFVLPAFLALEDQNTIKKEFKHRCYQIIERLYQECPGGVQLHYLVRPQSVFSSVEYIRFNEIELIPFPSE
jgi:hypothetical protein